MRALLGHERPALAAIVHHHARGNDDVTGHLRPQVERHLDPDPVIVPPVLTKSGLVAQPVLRLRTEPSSTGPQALQASIRVALAARYNDPPSVPLT